MLKSIFNYNKHFSFRSFNSSNPRFTFSVTTAPRVTPEGELFYKRDLPPHLIPFSSPEGKQLFQEAMKQGNMEAYFTLAEHLITQAEPSTCGPTSLSMIVNTLHIDPDRHWKGVWRWSSEYNLYCCPEDYLKKGLSLEQFANLAHCNRTKVQAFYHQSDKSDENTESIPLVIEGEDSGQVIHSKIEFNHEGVCLNKHGLLLKQSSYTTFLNNLVTSSRRTGLYMIMNFSRPHLGQTGEGHFNPIAGVHLNGKKAKALILDLAKFKYPGYWVDLEPLYDSMRPVDPSTGRGRGYMMISSNKVVNPTSRGISEDQKSMKECRKHIKTIPRKIEAFIASYLEKNNNRPTEQEVLYSILINLGRDCNYLLTYYLYDLSIRLESKQEKEIGLRKELFGFDKTKLCSIIKSTLVSKHKNINTHQLFWIVYDYQPTLMANILTCLLYALQRFIVSNTEIRLEDIFEDRISLSEPLHQEIAKIQKIFGIEE